MRICVSGTTNVGKSNFIDHFLAKYNNYSTPKTSFSDVIEAIFIKAKQDERETSSRDIQTNILHYMTQELSSYSKDDDVIINGCVLDNIIHSLYILEKLPYEVSGIDSTFIDTCVPHVREATKNIDIIFLLTSNKYNEDSLSDDDKELGFLYDALHQQYAQGTSPFLIKDDQPAIIEVFGSIENQMKYTEMYIDSSGKVLEGEDDLSKIIDPDVVRLQEQIAQKDK